MQRNIFLLLLAAILLTACNQHKDFYMIGEKDTAVSSISISSILIEGDIWYGNPTDQSGTHMGHKLTLTVNGHKVTNVNESYDIHTSFGPNQKFEVPYISYLNLDYFYPDLKVQTDMRNKAFNDELHIVGDGVSQVLWDTAQAIHEYPVHFETTIKIHPDRPLTPKK